MAPVRSLTSFRSGRWSDRQIRLPDGAIHGRPAGSEQATMRILRHPTQAVEDLGSHDGAVPALVFGLIQRPIHDIDEGQGIITWGRDGGTRTQADR